MPMISIGVIIEAIFHIGYHDTICQIIHLDKLATFVGNNAIGLITTFTGSFLLTCMCTHKSSTQASNVQPVHFKS